jgi:PAS domain S-box-containing protein
MIGPRQPEAGMGKMKEDDMFRNLPIRYKLLISYAFVFTLSISLGSALIYLLVRDTIKTNIESELSNNTNAILNLVETAAAVSIKNHLRAVAEKNCDLVRHLYEAHHRGALTETAAKAQAAELMLSQPIGESGYIYCVDSAGVVRVHPQQALRGTNVSDFAFVREQLKLKEGYIEYDWQNPGETKMRPKALYMVYFAPWDWIISASTYRTEFSDLIKVADFREAVQQTHLGPSGYAFVIDGQGTAIIHPKLQGVNILKADDLPNQYLMEMRARKSGRITYPWKNPGETSARMKLVRFNHIPDYDWIVASSSYLDEFYQPLDAVRNIIIATVAATLLLVLLLTFKISGSITQPLRKLTRHFDDAVKGSFTARMKPVSRDEIGLLATCFNRFMEQIEGSHRNLTSEIEMRRRVEAQLRESEARYRSVMEAAPDPIVVYDMIGRVSYLNPAFTRVFGWSLSECIGKKMDHFVPEENWDETTRMIETVASGKTLSATRTCRYNKAGEIVHVSISGATYRDHHGTLAGSVIILRDITLNTRLQQQVLKIGDRERQKIGQDLHDDLCPHLIGIHGLSSVLAANLAEAASPDTALGNQIVDLVGDAVDKARGLTRSLCPVHMVAHGLETALKDLAAHTAAVIGVDCRCRCEGSVELKDNTTATHLYFIAQEAVNNAVRHSGTDRVDICLQGSGERITLAISDRGGGISKERPRQGIGLQIMPSRAKMIGASFAIDSDPKTGTKVQVVLKKDALYPEE